MNHIINNRTCWLTSHNWKVSVKHKLQMNWLDSGKVGTPLVISSLNDPTDMWGPKSWQTNKLIESDIMLDLGLQYPILVVEANTIMHCNYVYWLLHYMNVGLVPIGILWSMYRNVVLRPFFSSLSYVDLIYFFE